ncbi:MAG TPA: Cache 3/Cache 2 fusion domain-containing protein [Candidatus Deferrimicrobiaceae bacterium]
MSFFEGRSLKFKLVTFSLALAIVPLIIGAAVLIRQGAGGMQDAIDRSLSGTANDVVRMIRVEERLTRSKLAGDAKVLREYFDKSGGRIPALGQDFSVVDKVTGLTGDYATLFRMDEGKMTRVSTSVKKNDGSRAVDTSIGSDSPVYQSIVAGKPFTGRAKVIDDWCLVSYEPVTSGGSVVGALFVGVKQKDVSSLREAINEIRIGKEGYAYILDRNGVVLMHPTLKDGDESLKDLPFVKEMLSKKDGSLKYEYKGRAVVADYRWFEPWGWSVVVRADKDDVYAAIDGMMRSSVMAVLGISVIAALLSFGIARSLASPLLQAAEELNEGARQVSGAAKGMTESSGSMAEGASRQAAALEETSSAMEEMASMTAQNAGNAGTAKSLSDRALGSIGQAEQSMDALVSAMEQISLRSREIGKIIKSIDEIAFQTNMLALNAAVEAARAGEAGAGFAVVADEVRNLANRAAESARSTAAMIEGTLAVVEAGSQLVHDTNHDFHSASTGTRKVGELIGEIAAACSEQSRGVKEIADAITSMDKVTQQNAAHSEEIASVSEQLSAQSATLEALSERLSEIVEGASAQQRLPAPALAAPRPARPLPRGGRG